MGSTVNGSFRSNYPSDITVKTPSPSLLTFILKCSYIPISIKGILFYALFRSYSHNLITSLNRLNPDYIVLTSDWFHSALIISSRFSQAKIHLIQPCFLDLWERKPPLTRKSLNKLLGFHNPLMFPKSTCFGMNNQSCHLHIWDKNLSEFYNSNNRSFNLISNPLYSSLLSKRSSKADRLNHYNKQILIMPADYSANFEDEYQKKLEDAYSDLVSTLRNANIDFRVKIHPNESETYWRDALKVNSLEILPSSSSPQDSIQASSYIISTNSYSSVEATLLGVPCLNLNPNSHLITITDSTNFSKYAFRNFKNTYELANFIFNSTYESYEKSLDEVNSVSENLLGLLPELSLENLQSA